ncbi:MAG: peptide-methionine (S)-S-oxide reductase MsrA [Pseudomonadota bacterium]
MTENQVSETAILAGGCFWGMEELIRNQPGVSSTRVGYTGGGLDNPTYNDVKKGNTGHAEAIEIVFDPSIMSYEKLLHWFFQIHDPTTKDRQGNDRGTQYRSAIFTRSDAQAKTAETVIAAVEASGKWPGRVVTEVTPATTFWEAEEGHQDYLQKYPNGYTCHYVRPDWTVDGQAA